MCFNSAQLCAIMKHEVRRGPLVAASEAALRHRIPKILVFLNKEVLPAHNDQGRRCAREGRKPI